MWLISIIVYYINVQLYSVCLCVWSLHLAMAMDVHNVCIPDVYEVDKY